MKVISMKLGTNVRHYQRMCRDQERTVMSLSIGTPKIIIFPFGTNGKLSILGVPIVKHIRVNQHFYGACVRHGTI